MEKEIDFAETNRKVSELFLSIQDEFLSTKPIFMRLNLMCNMISKGLSEGRTDADFDWDKVNGYLTKNVSEYDFNYFGRITSSEALFDANLNCRCASVAMGPWQKHRCKDCGTLFYMSYNEVHFYEEKGLHVPKRCKPCRDKRRSR